MPVKRLTIAIVLADGVDAKGGIERITRYLVRQFPQTAPDLGVFTQKTRLRAEGLAKHLTVPFALVQFMARCIGRGVDIAHINVAPRGSTPRKMLYAAAARLCGARIVLHLHGSGYDEFYAALSPWKRALVLRFFQRADRLIVLGGHWEAFARETLGIHASRLHVVSNGVPRPDGIATPDRAVPTIVFMGLVGERKGADVLVQALAELARRGHDFRCVVGGNGEVERYASIAARSGIGERVRFAGWVDENDVDAIMRDGDIFVLPSRAENQPVAILEAMARGLPVVSTSIGAIPEQLSDGETGLLVPPGQVEPLVEALERLILDPALRTRFGAAGRDRWSSRYSVEAMTARIAAIYRDTAA